MRAHPITRCLAALLLTCAAARADFQNGQYADLVLGKVTAIARFPGARRMAVDPVTHKVFVSDANRNRVLRFSQAASLQIGGAPEAVFGQPDFNSQSARTTADGMSFPEGLSMADDGILWVADTVNRRILRFDHAATSNSGAAADGVLGQPNFTSPASGGAENQMAYPTDVAADRSGRIWVADPHNNRVVRFDSAASKPLGGNADAVLGQVDFSQSQTASAFTASGMSQPESIAVESIPGLTQRLWVADSGNNRVLLFISPAAKPNGGDADKVLGQPNFVASSPSLSRKGFSNPFGLVANQGRLWVGDYANNRVLRFDAAANKVNGADADGVLGQSVYTSNSDGKTPGGLSGPLGLAMDGERLWIVDSFNKRMVRHENAATKGNGNDADGVLGASSLAAAQAVSGNKFSKSIRSIAIDPVTGKIFLCDKGNNRVLRFAAGSALSSGAAAEAVLGQPDLASRGSALSSIGMNGPSGVAMDHFGHLWVSDSDNNRLLRFDNAAALPSGSAAAHVTGQLGFATASSGTSPSQLHSPTGLAVESTFSRTTQAWTTKRLWLADTVNNRVLRFDDPVKSNLGMAASGVLGQPDMVSTAPAQGLQSMFAPISVALDITGNLWVSKENNHRVVRFNAAATKPNGSLADGVFEEIGPAGLAVTPQGRLFVLSYANGRVTWFNDAANRPNTAKPDGVLGQTSLTPPNDTVDGAWNNLGLCYGCALDAAGHLWVTDEDHQRVLRFTPSLDSTITTSGFNAQNHFTLTMSALVGETYELHSSPDLQDWSTTEATFRATIGLPYGVLSWTAPTVAAGRRFYRLQAP
jgi:sugar lactone lactonase YvrE